ncbi:MAG: Calx-beta domain-containing protein, partial [Bacteroidota bacterium]
EDEVNGQPVVRFGGHNNDRVFNQNMPDFPSTELSAILVYRTLDASDAQISYAAATGSDNEFLILNSSNITPLVEGNSAGNQGVAFNDNLWHIQTITWTNAGGNLTIYKDGTQAATTTISNGATLEPDGTLVLGAEQDSENGGYDAAADYDGDMSEFILFDRVLNAAQRVVVENYLGAKYDIGIANDFYAFNNAKGYDVIGIGQSGGAQHQEASDRVISISSASGIDTDGEFIFVGHDDRDISAWTTDEVDGDNIYRLQREWQYDETGAVGVFSISVDASTLPAAPSSEYNRYYLLSDADGNFSAGVTSHLMTNIGGDTYEVSGVDLSDGDHFTIAIVRPAVSFELASSALFESGGPALVNVNLNYALDEVVTVSYAINGSSTAISGADYVLADGTITFPAGVTTIALSAPLTDDTTPESDETLILDLSSPTNAQLGTITQHTVIIHDTDIANKIQFQSTASNGDESVTPINLTIEVNSADVSDMSVDWTITGGTATGGGIDYLSTSGTATVLGNGADTQATIAIDINEDVLDEVDETLVITLSNPSSNVNLGTNTEHIYTINDNDAEPTIQFQSATSSGNEGSSPANVEVALDAISGRDITINYTVTGGTATNGNVDFNLADGTLTIPAGDAQGFIQPTIVDDDLVEGAETITFSIAAPSGATLGSITANTLTITDNDNNGIIGPGGVGDETTNILWLRADDITGVSDGTDIDGWVDASGNANNMNDNNSNVPAFEENEINGLPAVRFGDSNNDRVFLQNMNDFPSNAITTVTVLRTSETNGTTWSYATGDQNNSYFQDRQQSGRFAIDGTITTPNVAFNDGSWHVNVHTWTSDGGDYAMRRDGSEMASGNTENGGAIEAGGTLVLGAEQDSPNGGYDANQDFDGELAEAILYNYVLNAAQLAIVENYLAAKYNGEFTISNSYFAFGSNFGHDVVGIGQESGDQHLAAQSDGNFTISTAAGLDADGDFLMIGHNNDDLTAWSTTEAPNGGANIQRIAREWIMDVSGDISSFSVTLDVSGFPATPAGYDTYYLLVDTDGDFSTSPLYYPMESLGGSEYEIGNVAVVDGGFMTFAVVRSEIQFNATASQEFEPDGPAVIPVELNFELNADATVDYAITGCATGGVTDYTLVGLTATITSGNTSDNINIPLTNDVVLE